MNADKVAGVLMAAGATGAVPMNDVMAALAWVQSQRVGPAAMLANCHPVRQCWNR